MLRSHIVGEVEIFDGVGLAAGLFIAVGLDYSGEILAALLAFSMLWVSLRDTRAPSDRSRNTGSRDRRSGIPRRDPFGLARILLRFPATGFNARCYRAVHLS